MSLRDRQLGGIPLSWGAAFILTGIFAICIPVIGYNFWFPLFGVPEELRKWLGMFGVGLYVYQCTGRVPVGIERAQLFFGTYTGESFPSGIYLLPRIPFPLISLVLEVMFKKDVSQYLGWVLEGDVSVESIITSFFSEGLTRDNIRVHLEGSLVFEVMNAATFLSQQGAGSNKDGVQSAISAEVSARIKQRVIALHTAEELYRGDSGHDSSFTKWITEACMLVEDFGVRLSRSPVVTVTIKSERVQNAFDSYGARELMTNNTNSVADAFEEFRKKLRKETSEEVAFMLFNAERGAQGLPAVTKMDIVKLK